MGGVEKLIGIGLPDVNDTAPNDLANKCIKVPVPDTDTLTDAASRLSLRKASSTDAGTEDFIEIELSEDPEIQEVLLASELLELDEEV